MQNIKKHRDFVDKYQATHNDKAMQKQLLADIVSDVYRDNVRTNDLDKYKHFIQNKDDVVEQIFNQLQEQQNANQSRTQNPSNRLLADTPSTGVGANGNGRETTSLHSKSDKPSERRDTNQSNNRNDSERSPSVLSDGAKTVLSGGVESNYQTSVNEIRRLAKSLSKFDFLASLSELGTKLFRKPNLANNQAHFDYVKAQSDEFGIKFPTDRSEYEKAVFAYWDKTQKSSVKDSDDKGLGIGAFVEKSINNPTLKDNLSLGSLTKTIAKKLEENGYDVAEYPHTLTSENVRHIINRHGDEHTEKQRGQLPMTIVEIEKIPNVLANPDYLVIGGKTRRGLNTIIYTKTMSDGTSIVVEEVRNGNKKQLAITTAMKFATGVNANPKTNPNLHVQNGAVASGLIVIDMEENVNPQTTSQALDNAIQATNQADFTLSDEMVQTGSVKDKLATNIAIIELLQTLKQENRQPTNDEKALMAKYTGFGGLSNAFPDSQGNYKKGFDTLGARLRNLMSRDEYENARASSTSAFFTPPNVINAMWDIAQRLGHNGGVALEPSAGVGAFIGHAPKNLPQKIIGTEIDPTTAAITNYLTHTPAFLIKAMKPYLYLITVWI